jgi:hypothetical protein
MDRLLVTVVCASDSSDPISGTSMPKKKCEYFGVYDVFDIRIGDQSVCLKFGDAERAKEVPVGIAQIHSVEICKTYNLATFYLNENDDDDSSYGQVIFKLFLFLILFHHGTLIPGILGCVGESPESFSSLPQIVFG